MVGATQFGTDRIVVDINRLIMECDMPKCANIAGVVLDVWYRDLAI